MIKTDDLLGPEEVLLDLILEAAESKPVASRVNIYFSVLQKFTLPKETSEQIRELAESLQAIQESTQQLKLSFVKSCL